MNKPTPIKVHSYRHRYIIEYSDGSATFSGMKYENIPKAKKAIGAMCDKALNDFASAPESGQNDYKNGLELAKKFHELYEKNAPNYGYETRKETREFKEDSPNGKLMIAVCEQILASLPAPESGGEEKDYFFTNLRMAIIDACNNWREENERETIPAKAFHVIADNVAKELTKDIYKDFVPSVQSSDVKPVASHTSTSSNSIEQLTDDEIKAAKEWWKTLSIHIRTCVRWLEGDYIDGSMTDDKYVKVYRKRDSNNFPDEYGVWEVRKTNSSLSKEEGKDEKDLEQLRIDYYEDKIDMLNRIYKEETERLKGLIATAFNLSICDLPDEEQKQLWQQFAKENGLKGE